MGKLPKWYVGGSIALSALSSSFSRMYVAFARPSITPGNLLRPLPQILCSIRSERMLVVQLEYNLLFCCFVGLNLDDQRTGHNGRAAGTRSSANKTTLWNVN